MTDGATIATEFSDTAIEDEARRFYYSISVSTSAPSGLVDCAEVRKIYNT